MNPKICTEIENYLAEYCSDSLERLHYRTLFVKAPFDVLARPLEKLRAISLYTLLNPAKRNIRSTQFITERNLPNLRTIFINTSTTIDSQEKIIHDNVKYLRLWYTEATTYPFSFRNLNYIQIFGCIKISDSFCEYINELEYLVKLKIRRGICSLDAINSFVKILKLPNILANLKDLEFSLNVEMDVEDILNFTKQSQSLKKISISARRVADGGRRWWGRFFSKLGEEWEWEYIFPYEPFSYEYCYVFRKRILNTVEYRSNS